MNERQLQFRVGIFVIVAACFAGVMVFQFGEFQTLLEKHYVLRIHFDTAPGVEADAPVKMNGVTIGTVRDVSFDTRRGGVTATVGIKEKYPLRADSKAKLSRSLLGDSTIEFSPGISPRFLKHGARIEGEPAIDPLEIVQHFDEKVTVTLASFTETSREWQRVGANLNQLVETNHGNLNDIVERTAVALTEFTVAMRSAHATLDNANKIIGDPNHQRYLSETLAALPVLVKETHETVLAARNTIGSINANMQNLNAATTPLAQKSESIVGRLDNSLGHLEYMLSDLRTFSQLLTSEDGTLRRLAMDPDLYHNLDQSANALSVLLENMQPVVRDMQIFSDKVARHPELIGVGGALNGSSGLKDPPSGTPVREAQRPRSGLFHQRN